MYHKKRVVAAVLVAATLAGFAHTAHAGGLHLKDGHWRIEVQGLLGTNVGNGEHAGDVGFVTELEYETPFAQRWTFAFKAIPALYYNQEKTSDDNIGGVGFGIGLRIYQRADERTGFFGEIGSGPVFHFNQFEGNGSNINFYTQFGVGYKFRSGWHVAAKYVHLSNAGTDNDNDGVNNIVLAFGTDL